MERSLRKRYFGHLKSPNQAFFRIDPYLNYVYFYYPVSICKNSSFMKSLQVIE